MLQRRHIARRPRIPRKVRRGAIRLGLRAPHLRLRTLQRLPHARPRLDQRAHLGHRRPTRQDIGGIRPDPAQPVQRRLDPQHQRLRLGAPRGQILDPLDMRRTQIPCRLDPAPQGQHQRIRHQRRPLGPEAVQRARQRPQPARRCRVIALQHHQRLGPAVGRGGQIRHSRQPHLDRLQRAQPRQRRLVPLHRLQRHHRRIARRPGHVMGRLCRVARLDQPLVSRCIGVQPLALVLQRPQTRLEVGQRPRPGRAEERIGRLAQRGQRRGKPRQPGAGREQQLADLALAVQNAVAPRLQRLVVQREHLAQGAPIKAAQRPQQHRLGQRLVALPQQGGLLALDPRQRQHAARRFHLCADPHRGVGVHKGIP